MTADVQRWLFEEVKQFIALATDAVDSDEYLDLMLSRLGWNVLYLPDDVKGQVQKALAGIRNAAEELPIEPLSLTEVMAALDATHQIVMSLGEVVYSLSELSGDLHLDSAQLLHDLVSFLTFEHIYGRHPKLFFGLNCSNLVSVSQTTEDPVRDSEEIVRLPPVTVDFRLHRVAELVRDPVTALRNAYLPGHVLGDSVAARDYSDRHFPVLSALLSSFGFQHYYGLTEADRCGFSDEPSFDRADRTLHIISPGQTVNAGLLVLHENEPGGPGLQITVSGLSDFAYATREWFLELEAGGQFPSIILGPSGVTILDGQSEAHINASAARFGSADEPALLIGSRHETRFEVGLFRFEAHFNSQAPDFGVGFYAHDCAFVLHRSNVDGFLGQFLPEDGIQARFNLGASWSRLNGFQLCGSLGLEVELPLNLSIQDVLKLDSLYLALRGDADALSVGAGISPVLALGPVTAIVQRIGLRVAFGFGDGNGKGFHFGLMPPSGVGLAVSAAGVTGGGFLEFDEPNGRYAGFLALKFSKFSLAAFGLITTRMPDGKDGFALLISITTVFTPPIQIAMGFTLSGVGGLIAINHSMNVDALRAGLRTRTLDSILFPDPETVVENAGKIISDLRTVFPPAEGQYIIGPMVKFGWGTPNIITADLGIFVEFPDPVRIVLMGQLEAELPCKDDALIVIHLDVLGVVDFDRQELTFQASLYDSRILTFELYGDAAFLLGWGGNPRFALSLGGFHPKFTPPPPALVFADLKRLTLKISNGSSLRLSCQSYLALTPNSLQFGARVELYAAFGPLRVDGFLGFDALIYFSPFYFEVEICGSVHLRFKGAELFGVDLYLLLSGPTPWHVRGKARIKILFFSIGVSFSATWGRKERVALPAKDPLEPLIEALSEPTSWGGLLPPGYIQVETLRSLDAKPEAQVAVEDQAATEDKVAPQVVVHPLGGFEVRQNVVPLGIQIEKFNNAPVAGHDLFDIAGITVNGDTLDPKPVREFFAPGQFMDLTADQRLALPGFEEMKAGVSAQSAELIEVWDDEIPYKSLKYESDILGPDGTWQESKQKGEALILPWRELTRRRVAGVINDALGHEDRSPIPVIPVAKPRVRVVEETYCVVARDRQREGGLDPDLVPRNRCLSRLAADQLLRVQLERRPDQVSRLIVSPEYEVPA